MIPEILFEDNDILVCYKPAGLAVQTKRLGQQDLESWLKNYRAAKKEAPYIGVVHRLDQPVEGVMVFAKNQKAAAGLSAQVQKHDLGKFYCAVGSGTLTDAFSGEGTLTDYLTFDPRTNVGKVTGPKDPKAKKAVLDYRVVGSTEQGVCFDIHLHTGRHHQIRLQLMHAGFPLVGDSRYGGPKDRTIALCSYRLQFLHPVAGRPMDFTVKPKNPVFSGIWE